MILRKATLADAQRLFDWRNDPQTRAASHSTEILNFDSHLRWLEKTLLSPNRVLYIAEIDGIAVGTARADKIHGVTELSWTVAPDRRGTGVGTCMVRLLMEKTSGPLIAEVRCDNLASLRIAKKCGLHRMHTADGIVYFEYHHLPTQTVPPASLT